MDDFEDDFDEDFETTSLSTQGCFPEKLIRVRSEAGDRSFLVRWRVLVKPVTAGCMKALYLHGLLMNMIGERWV